MDTLDRLAIVGLIIVINVISVCVSVHLSMRYSDKTSSQIYREIAEW